jgi:regulator of protease activity HflC (stomatin/prohibitin superfamily)
MIGFIIFLAIVLLAILSGFFTVQQQTAKIVERFGRFKRTAIAGLHFKIPLIDRIAGRVTLRVQQLDVKVETKTKDNVFLNVTVSVQYVVRPEKIYDAFYRLENPALQIRSYVFDVVRARVPQIILDDVFEKKDEIADTVKSELDQVMDVFGYNIIQTLVTDIDPDEKVKISMNEINAAQRLRIAAEEKGEADKILKVKSAEADARSKALQGQGVADQRTAIVNGLRESVGEFQKTVSGTSPQDVMNLVLMTQYFDTLKEIGETSKTNTILIPHSPGNISELTDQIRNAVITANQVGNNSTQSAHQEKS